MSKLVDYFGEPECCPQVQKVWPTEELMELRHLPLQRIKPDCDLQP